MQVPFKSRYSYQLGRMKSSPLVLRASAEIRRAVHQCLRGPLFLLLLSCEGATVAGQAANSDLVWNNLHGPVKEILTEWYDFGSERWIRDERVLYNGDGNIMAKDSYSNDDIRDGGETRSYDAKGNNVRTVEYDASGVTFTWEYSYSDSGLYQGYTRYDRAGLQYDKTVIIRNRTGKRTGDEYWGVAGELLNRGVYEYNTHGDRIRTTYYDKAGAFIRVDSVGYVYDANGKMVEETKYYNGERVVTKYQDGKKVSELNYDANNLFGDSSTMGKTFNEHGDCILDAGVYDGKKLSIRYVYEYDAHGNWVQQHNITDSGAKGGYKRRSVVYSPP